MFEKRNDKKVQTVVSEVASYLVKISQEVVTKNAELRKLDEDITKLKRKIEETDGELVLVPLVNELETCEGLIPYIRGYAEQYENIRRTLSIIRINLEELYKQKDNKQAVKLIRNFDMNKLKESFQGGNPVGMQVAVEEVMNSLIKSINDTKLFTATLNEQGERITCALEVNNSKKPNALTTESPQMARAREIKEAKKLREASQVVLPDKADNSGAIIIPNDKKDVGGRA